MTSRDARGLPSTPLTLFLRTAAPGRRYVTLEHLDRHVVSYAHRIGVNVKTERATLFTGSHSEPAVQSAVIVTILEPEQ